MPPLFIDQQKANPFVAQPARTETSQVFVHNPVIGPSKKSKELTYIRGTPPLAPAPKLLKQQPVDTNTAEQFKRSIFSEVSNRLVPAEVHGMMNAAVNQAIRSKKPLADLLVDPNYFQGVANKRYATSADVQGKDKDTWDFVSRTVDEAINTGLGMDNTDNHFVHITSGEHKDKLVTMSEDEFGVYLSKKGKDRDAYAASLLGYQYGVQRPTQKDASVPNGPTAMGRIRGLF